LPTFPHHKHEGNELNAVSLVRLTSRQC
jgi:hypothetical protein